MSTATQYCGTMIVLDYVGLCLTTSRAEVTMDVPMLAIGPPPNTQQPVVEKIILIPRVGSKGLVTLLPANLMVMNPLRHQHLVTSIAVH